ncbi:DNA-3-methyladenine glycosylase [Roseivirga sp. E12]|uniref:DNA-3-methyladenine glycosylase n=1 Tax=Roseivirga sp. E12 TaxID=2819237 RepID=UPI001ABC3387|nr:DNA-3-methyladenine glycosylase [Roseivirga sp. E12]MBO3697343.1 DNA-3-methyladenine glycosylase [Roseivirga sp. E12]
MKLSPSFYQGRDVVQIAKSLLGKELHTNIAGLHTSGIITEVEAYAGRDDKACHANNGLRSKRTEVMYHAGGVSYVYLCYGIHHLFNVVTNVNGKADAILVRAIEPILGIEHMLERRNQSSIKTNLTSGPGTLTKALGISTKQHYGISLQSEEIWIEDVPKLADKYIVTSKRIGVDYAEEDALKPWRFYIKDNPWISKK